MLHPDSWRTAEPEDRTLTLLVLIDTEEEFDWSRKLARENTAVSAMAAQHRAHRIFEKFSVKPIYVIDYPVASQDGAPGRCWSFMPTDCVRSAPICTPGSTRRSRKR